MAKAIIVTTAGEVREAELSTLEDYQKAVGGYIEQARLVCPGGTPKAVLIVNEEGLLVGLPRNLLIEQFAETFGGPLRQPLVGDVAIVGDLRGSEWGNVPAWVKPWLDARVAALANALNEGADHS